MDLRFLQRFEVAKLIEERTEQLENGAEPIIEVLESDDTTDIAFKEFYAKMIPLKIKRVYPNGEERVLDPNCMIWEPH